MAGLRAGVAQCRPDGLDGEHGATGAVPASLLDSTAPQLVLVLGGMDRERPAPGWPGSWPCPLVSGGSNPEYASWLIEEED